MSHAVVHRMSAAPLSCSQHLDLTLFAKEDEDEDENLRFSLQSLSDLTQFHSILLPIFALHRV